MLAAVDAALAAHVSAGARLTLGLSGGVDSIVLLDALVRLAGSRDFSLDALHVHHGLSPNADRWAEFVVQFAQRYNVPCRVRKVDVGAYPGLGVEAAARAARYAAYAECDTDFIVLAHQRDDQAETLLLQLVRGAGVQGLAAMPTLRPLCADRARPQVLRPLLGVSRETVERYAAQRQLAWVEDESNRDVGYARNRLRHEVLPALQAINPAATANIARAAAHLADAAQLLDALAQEDLGRLLHGEALDLNALAALGDARARNALRGWLASKGLPTPASEELREALRQLYEADADAAPVWTLGEVELRRYRERAWLVRKRPEAPEDFCARWNGEAVWPLPELDGRLHFDVVSGAGLALRHLSSMTARVRQGGERFRPGVGRPHRLLKHLLQESAIPPWRRERLPLLYVGDTLAAVPGIGVAPEFAADADESGWLPRWETVD